MDSPNGPGSTGGIYLDITTLMASSWATPTAQALNKNNSDLVCYATKTYKNLTELIDFTGNIMNFS